MSSQDDSESKPDITRSQSDAGDRNGRRKGKYRNNQRRFPNTTKFKGETEALSGHIYDVSNSGQGEQFSETTKKLASYSGRTCKEPQDIRLAIEEVKEVSIPIPTERSITDTTLKAKLYEKDIEIWSKRESLYRQNKSSLYSVALGQCSEGMRAKLEADSTFEGINTGSDLIELLKLIRKVSFAYESKKYPYLAAYNSIRSLYGNYQKNYSSVDSYLETFQNLVQVSDHCGGNFGLHSKLINDILTKAGITSPTDDQQRAAETESKEKYLAMAFLCGLNKEKYQGLMDDLSNSFLNGRDEYPETVVEAHSLVLHWRGKKSGSKMRYNDGVNFSTIGEEEDNDDFVQVNRGSIIRKKNGQPVKCFTCGGNHFKTDCPQENGTNTSTESTNVTATASTTNATQQGSNISSLASISENSEVPVASAVIGTAHTTTSNNNQEEDDWGTYSFGGVQFLGLGTEVDGDKINLGDELKDLLGNQTTISTEHIMQQSKGESICKDWLLLDNQSTVDVFANGRLLTDIQEVPIFLKILSTGGISKTNKIGYLNGYGWVWYHKDGIANILSLARVKNKFRITFDSGSDNMFHVYDGEKKIRSYRESERGLYYSNVREHVNDVVCINTVKYNKSKHSRRIYLRALNARILQNKLTGPSYKHFKEIVRNKQINNCPITETDIDNAQEIFGESLQCLKGKMTRNPSVHARGILIRVPDNILASYGNVTMSADVMSVNGVRFLITHSRHIRFTTNELLPSLNNNVLLGAILNVRRIYKKRGFMLRMILMDGAFESLRGALAEKDIEPNICSENEHVGEIERTNRTVKERCRGVYNTLPFNKLPGRLVAELVSSTVFWLNALHPGVHLLNNLSPRTLVTGRTIDYKRHCKHEFGAYVQTHEATDNTMAPRTIGAIALRPTGNEQGGWFYLSLSTGRKINRLHASELPMPEHVIDQVHRMARRNKSGIEFRNRINNLMEDENDDKEIHLTHLPSRAQMMIYRTHQPRQIRTMTTTMMMDQSMTVPSTRMMTYQTNRLRSQECHIRPQECLQKKTTTQKGPQPTTNKTMIGTQLSTKMKTIITTKLMKKQRPTALIYSTTVWMLSKMN